MQMYVLAGKIGKEGQKSVAQAIFDSFAIKLN
jgi:hypothetical protein